MLVVDVFSVHYMDKSYCLIDAALQYKNGNV